MKILFICSSNICRSPFCEYQLKRMVSKDIDLKDKIEWIKSAAVFHQTKRTKNMFPKGYDYLLRDGFTKEELDAHSPYYKKFVIDWFEDADVIIGMTKMHKFLTPKKYRKKYISLAMASYNRDFNISDPFLAKTQESYDEQMEQLKIILNEYYKNLKKSLSND